MRGQNARSSSSLPPSLVFRPLTVSPKMSRRRRLPVVQLFIPRSDKSALPLMPRSQFHRSSCARSGAQKYHRIKASPRLNAKRPVEGQLCRRQNNHPTSNLHSTTETSNDTIHQCARPKRCADKWCAVKDLLGRVRGQKDCAVSNSRFNVKREMLHNKALHRSGGPRRFLNSEVVRRRPVNLVVMCYQTDRIGDVNGR